FAVSAAGTSVFAQSSPGIATVQSLKGELRSDSTRLAEGARVRTGRLNTGPGAQALLRFDDGTQVTLDENTILRSVDFEPATSGGGAHIVLDLLGGGARVVTGDVARRDPRQFSLRTPHASLGVRGPSDFTVSVVDGTHVTTARGSVLIANAGTELV